MTMRWLVFAGLGIAGLTMIAAQPAEARTRHKVPAAWGGPGPPRWWHPV
jgi:hypothetical protein